MSDDPQYYTTYSASDGRTWVKPMPERVQRELNACRAIDRLGHQIGLAQSPRQAAQAALNMAKGDVSANLSTSDWLIHVAALLTAIDDVEAAGNDTIMAVKRAFWLE